VSCELVKAFPNLEHQWDTGCPRPGEGGGLSMTLWTRRGQSMDKGG
jgi:hypothetical protein